MTDEERWEFLLVSSKRVLKAFREGRNPSFRQLDKLQAAIDSIDSLKICRHRMIEDCDCGGKR